MDILRSILPVLMALGVSLMIDAQMRRRGLLPPNFRAVAAAGESVARRVAFLRTAAITLLALVFWLGVFAPIGQADDGTAPLPTELAVPDRFALHVVLVVTLALWYLLAFGGAPGATTRWVSQFGLGGDGIAREIGIGVVAGIAGWFAVIGLLLLVALVVYLLGGEEALPAQPPPVITLVVALPIAVRVGLSLSAGIVEELFFRGFLQPRCGVALSTILFVLAHLSYEQPFLLIGVSLLSVLFAALVLWRQNIWAAMTAHTVFDAIQLLFVIPNAIRILEREEEGLVASVLVVLSRL